MKSSVAAVVVLVVIALASLAQAEQKCTPGARKQESCNTCVCTPTGAWGCTRKSCRPIIREKRETCTPGAVEKRDCNTCRCAADGSSWACSRKRCLPASGTAAAAGPGPSRAKRSPQHCQPNSTFKKDCNTCTCNKDGTNAVCTLKACLKPRTRREIQCTPGTTFKDKCNTCRCSANGKNAACTLKACPPGTY